MTPREREALTLLAEECAEVVQAVTKALRHGLDSYHPADPRTSNRELIAKEVLDVHAALTFLKDDIRQGTPDELMAALLKKKKYLHHQPEIVGGLLK